MQIRIKLYLLIKNNCVGKVIKYYYNLLCKYYDLFFIDWLILKILENFISHFLYKINVKCLISRNENQEKKIYI